MMDTVLNVGLNPETLKGLAAAANNGVLPMINRRLISMFGRIVKGIDGELFDDVLNEFRLKPRVNAIPT